MVYNTLFYFECHLIVLMKITTKIYYRTFKNKRYNK
uniref:Uncharacterized protein n=1 Tax=Phyllymenia taiwanensis TaxID=1260292 RepID=R9XYB9_9FLOR|nr:hypothetical protein [Grateloupia taiwanensis]AGO19775.1 hypothetical protein [Grateloupia taiwanensis]